MMKFIELSLVAHSTLEGDTVAHIDIDSIHAIVRASKYDQKQRREIASLIHFRNGNAMAFAEPPEMILQKIKDAQNEFNTSSE